MEDFPLLILFFIIYLVASSSSGKKKKNNRSAARQGPMRNRRQGEKRDVRAQQRDCRTIEGFHTAFEASSDAKRCEQKRMHLHEVSNEQMQCAAEGEDPCHAGGIRNPLDSQQGDLLEEEDAQHPLRQDVLRGVIMSEILTRPHERRAMQRSRQRTNGY